MKGDHADLSPVAVTSFKSKGPLPDDDLAFQEVSKISALDSVEFDEKEKKDDSSEKSEDKNPTGPPPVNLFRLFRFADCYDYCLIFIGILAGWGSGLCMPAMTILFGDLTNSLVYYGAEHQDDGRNSCGYTNVTIGGFKNVSDEEFRDDINQFGIGLAIIGTFQLVVSYIMVACLNFTAERQVYRIRNLFLQCVLRQDIAWYDMNQTGEFASRTSEDLAKLQDGIGEKIGMFNYFIGCFIFCIINAFYHGWELTLVMLSISPLMMVCMGILGVVQTKMAKFELEAYAKAGSIAEEVLTAIRTVVAFGGEQKEAERYTGNLDAARKAGIIRGMTTAIGAGALWMLIYGGYALAFWYGIKLMLEPKTQYDPSSMIIVFFSVMMGSMNIGQSTPYVEAFSQARASAAAVFQIIDREPAIDSSSEEGEQPEELIGNIDFEDVHFHYPSRTDVVVLNGLTLNIHKGETVALVGESGCGKSTTVQLLQRFYDPEQGTVKLDGRDIRTLNLAWLREHIGVVGQEPILFGTTIAENIRYGKDGATQEEIEKAAKMANAHNFIMKLPHKYDTLVGDRGAQLSGGQKQRVAIARALIKDPKILLLDEATSALDSESEAVVQHALDKARLGRTTIVIAHRLSTIRNADKIAAFCEGKIAELGTHEELMAIKGIYYTLATTQTGGVDAEQQLLAKTTSFNEKQAHRMLEYERSLSINSSNSFDEITQGAAPLARVASFRSSTRRKHSKDDDDDDELILRPSITKIMKYNSEEYIYIILGCVGALGMGFSSPAFSLIFGDIMGVMSECDPDDISDDSIFYSCMFIVIGVITGICMFLQIFMFTYAGEYLTQRLRRLSFAAMVNQDMGWFDLPKNSVGALCSRLSNDASAVQGATGSRIGTIIQSICTLGASTIIALVLCWQLALVSMCFIPLVLVAAYFHGKMVRGQSMTEMVSLDSANKFAIEAISNIRTVASLHKEERFRALYQQELKKPHQEALRGVHLRGLIFGFSQSVAFYAYATSMYYGGTLILDGRVDYETVFKVAELLILGTMMVGQAFSFAPNANKGVISAARIFLLLEQKPEIDSASQAGLRLPDDTPGMIEFKDTAFHYPARPDVPVLRKLELTINPGHMVALVGSSGCGKSTCIQLLERFYDPKGGSVLMDGHDIRQLNVGWLRSKIGIVSQEPILFHRSIAENIAYGDNSRVVSTAEITAAAINANIHNFIMNLPQAYETNVGDKGTQLSGGQKQRIAIARALVRNPKILLLDEATSALDTESEKVVQEALEKAQVGRTSITVAHRLSTIRDANMIAVIHRGEVVETGTHDELIKLKGHYYKFYQTQAKGRAS